MNRRTFAKHILAAPAVISAAMTAALGETYARLYSSGAEKKRTPLDDEVDHLLQEEPFFDTAAADRFFRYPGEKPLAYHPGEILRVAGGGVLGIGHLTAEPPVAATNERQLETPGSVNVVSAWDGPGNVQQILRELESLRRTVEKHADKVAIALTADQMVQVRKSGRLALVPGLDTGNETNGDPLVLGELYRLGVRKMAMVHGAATPFSGSGVADPRTEPGLSPLGRDMVAECNRLGIMVDVSHSSDLTYWGVMACARRPVIATHSGARTVAFARRNMSDEMIRALVKNGGMIGVGAELDMNSWQRVSDTGYYDALVRVDRWMMQKYPAGPELAEALRTPAKLKEAEKALGMADGLPGKDIVEVGMTEPEGTLRHIDYLTKLIGFDHIGIGTDVTMASGKYPWMIRGIAAGLIKRNYSREQIRKIFSGNLLRVFRENEAKA